MTGMEANMRESMTRRQRKRQQRMDQERNGANDDDGIEADNNDAEFVNEINQEEGNGEQEANVRADSGIDHDVPLVIEPLVEIHEVPVAVVPDSRNVSIQRPAFYRSNTNFQL